MADEWNINLDCSVYIESSAAVAVVGRKGNGKLRHVKVGHLWIHDKAEKEDIGYHKVKGEENPQTR